ncbi:hypothetical protein, variant [Capsaspora owczarzaki ATCC 30864]|uniref:F-box domain-containing protein n=1 Tax=Capsaspora owczarzaki (strain ATCC 30864) TaxID=595528 RepID=A0A0D2X0L9_CAPO3|nr:hypothetical protein, variant [Capsaspora owczarzaki ATCC 30864]
MELLPAEIVMEIFERLPFRDVLSASRVCRFWFEVAIDYLSASIDLTHEHRGIDDKTLRFILTRLQPRQLNLTNCDEITQTGRGYLMDHGQSLETLTAPSLLVSAHNMMTRMDNLTNLEELVIKAIHLTPEFRLPPNLKKLWVESQFVVSNDWSWEDTPYLTDVRVASMQLDERPEQLNRLISSVRLSALRMHHCSVYVTQPLAGLENLHTLELHNPVRYNFTQKYTYIPLFASCPNLVNLVIREADGLTDKMVDDWLALLPNLQSLSLNQGRASRLSDATLTAIATRCPKLRELKLESFLQMTDVGLTTLASSCPKLETVWIPFCRNIGDAGLQSLFTWCKDLRDLDISGCTHVTEDMIGSMIKNGISLDVGPAVAALLNQNVALLGWSGAFSLCRPLTFTLSLWGFTAAARHVWHPNYYWKRPGNDAPLGLGRQGALQAESCPFRPQAFGPSFAVLPLRRRASQLQSNSLSAWMRRNRSRMHGARPRRGLPQTPHLSTPTLWMSLHRNSRRNCNAHERESRNLQGI